MDSIHDFLVEVSNEAQMMSSLAKNEFKKVEKQKVELQKAVALNEELVAENAQIRTENGRVRVEIGRVRARNGRFRAECERVCAENEQVKAESARVQAENEDLKARVQALWAEKARRLAKTKVWQQKHKAHNNEMKKFHRGTIAERPVLPVPPRRQNRRSPGRQLRLCEWCRQRAAQV